VLAFEPAAKTGELTADAARTPAAPTSMSRRETLERDGFEVDFIFMLQKTEKRIKFLTQMTQVWTAIHLIIFAPSFSMEWRIAASPRSISTPFPNADTHSPIEIIKRSVASSARERSSRQASI
jgi:hypothetical protein